MLENGDYILGNAVYNLEKKLADYVGVKECISCASGTDALLISLMAAGIREGDEVITTPFTFFATAGSITRLGAKPIFVDIERESFNINPNQIEKKITEKINALTIQIT